jgi:transposase-like protein
MAKTKQTIAKELRYTVNDFNRDFPTDDDCLEYIKEQRWTDGITLCAKCGQERKHYRVSGRTAYACDHCGNHIYPLAGTIFEKSSTSLKTWFYAMYLIGSTRCGISAKQIQRETGVTYKTAWRMFKQIRTLLSEDLQLEGDAVEIDETYVGGKRKNRHGTTKNLGRPSGKDSKTPVMGMVQRGGSVIACVTPSVKAATIFLIIEERVLPSSTIYTDEYNVYDRLATPKNGYDHKRIKHAEKIRHGRRTYEFNRGVLVAREAWIGWRLPRRFKEVLADLSRRIFVPVQSPQFWQSHFPRDFGAGF